MTTLLSLEEGRIGGSGDVAGRTTVFIVEAPGAAGAGRLMVDIERFAALPGSTMVAAVDIGWPAQPAAALLGLAVAGETACASEPGSGSEAFIARAEAGRLVRSWSSACITTLSV